MVRRSPVGIHGGSGKGDSVEEAIRHVVNFVDVLAVAPVEGCREAQGRSGCEVRIPDVDDMCCDFDALRAHGLDVTLEAPHLHHRTYWLRPVRYNEVGAVLSMAGAKVLDPRNVDRLHAACEQRRGTRDQEDA